MSWMRLVVALVPLLLASPFAAATPPSPLFASPVYRSASFANLPQWRRVLQRIRKEWPVYEACMANSQRCPGSAARAWSRLLASLRGASPRQQLEAVDRFGNRKRYGSDRRIYGRSDYWATPLEFLARSGDCEDYAIFKYVSLRLLGVPAERMRLFVVDDTRRRIAHAVLAVELGRETYLLDNLAPAPRPAAATGHYRPYYAVNEEAKWVYPRSYAFRSLDTSRLKPAR